MAEKKKKIEHRSKSHQMSEKALGKSPAPKKAKPKKGQGLLSKMLSAKWPGEK